LNPVETENDVLLLRRLTPFLIAGLKAPLPDLGLPGLLETHTAPRGASRARADTTRRETARGSSSIPKAA